MHVIADLCGVPRVPETSLSVYIAEIETILDGRWLCPRLHAYGTNVESEWDAVMGAVREVQVRLHAMVVKRITSYIRSGMRTDRRQTGEDKIQNVREKRV